MGNLINEAADAPTDRSVSLGTWNMDHWRRTAQQRRDGWEFLRSGTGADVMLLQESVVPAEVSRNRYAYRELAGSRPQGTTVVALAEGLEAREIDAVRTRYGATRFSMLGSHPGAVIAALVELPGIGAIICVSVYGVMNVYSQTTMFHLFELWISKQEEGGANDTLVQFLRLHRDKASAFEPYPNPPLLGGVVEPGFKLFRFPSVVYQDLD